MNKLSLYVRLKIKSKKTNLTAKMGNNSFRVGKRSSSNFFRVYLKSKLFAVQFQINSKKIVLKTFQHYLFTNQFKVL